MAVRVLLDACVPRRLRRELQPEFQVETAQDIGLDQLQDGALLDAMSGRFDILITRDRNLVYQQRIVGRAVAVVVLRTKEQSLTAFLALLPELRHTLTSVQPGSVALVPV